MALRVIRGIIRGAMEIHEKALFEFMAEHLRVTAAFGESHADSADNDWRGKSRIVRHAADHSRTNETNSRTSESVKSRLISSFTSSMP
jgi:hypothetical protein